MPAGYNYDAKLRIASAGLSPASTAASLAAPAFGSSPSCPVIAARFSTSSDVPFPVEGGFVAATTPQPLPTAEFSNFPSATRFGFVADTESPKPVLTLSCGVVADAFEGSSAEGMS